MRKPPPTPDPLNAWRARFPVETRHRGRALARDGRVEIVQHDGGLLRARVGARGERHEVELDVRSQRPSPTGCTCAAFAADGACEHQWAVLEVALGGARGRVEGPVDAPSLGEWLADVRRIERDAGEAEREAGEERPEVRVRYVLRLDARGADGATLLATERARPLARGGFGKFGAFSVLDPRRDALGPEDRRIAALLRGSGLAHGTSTVAAPATGAQAERDDAVHRLDAEQTLALVPVLAATGRLFWSRGSAVSPRPLALDDGPPWKACLTLAPGDEPNELRLDARLERGAERVPLSGVRGVLAGDLIVLDERVLRARLGRGRAWLARQIEAPPPPFPPHEAPAILLELARRELDVEPGPGMEQWIEARRPVPRLVLAAPAREDGRFGAVTGTIELDYGVARVLATDPRPLLPTGRGVLRRYFEVENALVARALAAGASAGAPGTLRLALERVPELVRALGAEGWVVEGEGARWRSLGPPRVSVASGVDWFEIEGRFEGVAASEMPALLAALRRGESTVRLGDGTTGILPDEWIARWRAALALGEAHGDKLRFRASQAWFVDLLLDEFADRESERLWREQRARLDEFRGIGPSREPAGFRGELRPYQREGLGWLEFLERHRFGGCLADDMGLGKTVQVLAWLQGRKERDPNAAPALIVAPKSLTHNWLEEARRFTPALSALEYVGTERRKLRGELARADLVLTTYGTVRADVEDLAALHFGVVVLDEAQAIKNEGSRTARSVRLLRAQHRLALSGTPIENHLGELWSLFEFLDPGLLGRSGAFQALVATQPGAEVGPDTRALIARAVRPFLLRRTKEEVLRDLPERTEQTVLCDMEAAQRREYVELREHFRAEILGKKSDAELARDKLGILEMLLRLRQAACHPGLLDAARADEGCAKFDAFFPMLEDVLESGHKALVFSQFTSFLALLRRRLDREQRAYGYLDGKTPAKQRAAEVARFQQDPAQKLFLISLKAGGTGLNLTAADYVFLLDPWWNPAVEAQAIGRSHRIGQERHVFAYRLVCRDTVEERVLELQARKRELAAAILEESAVPLRDLTREDLERLLS